MEGVDVIVRRVRAGEVEAFAEIVRAFERPVWRVVAALLQDADAAAELLQQVFVDAYSHLGQYQLGTDFEAWLKTIARNRVRQEMRRLSRETAHLQVYRERLEARLNDLAEAERYESAYLDALRSCRDQLQDHAAEALRLRYDHGRSFDEIASALQMTRAAVEKLLSRIRVLLRQCIERRLYPA